MNHRPEPQHAVQEFADAGFAGVRMRVTDERGSWVGSAGVSELGAGAPPPTDGRFWIGSSAKTFTAAPVLSLVAEGAIGLDDPVADRPPRS
ncbi:serine hydrolase [Streptomyces sp. NPDC004266]|uniref:serine hydrolase n=1 Tax=Streptomyces sp. NPDC004266 TaxID=3364693 RepID=UPI003684715E